MRKIVAGLFITLDGVTESPDKWNFPYFDEEMGQAIAATMMRSDTLLLGRRTFEEFAAYWPNRTSEDDPFAGYINHTPKIVVSTTLKDATWQPTTVIGEDVMTRIRALKEQPGKDIGMTGSVTLVRSLLQEGLLDELNLMVHPIALGTGRRLFDDLGGEITLKLADSRTFGSGVVSLTFEPA